MPSTPSFDNERPHDWGKTSTDYAGFRPGYPDSFFSTLRAIGIDVDGRRVLDLGSGPGVLAIPFALQGGLVTALDIAENQIAAARDLARKQGAHIDFVVADAHSTGLPSDSYDMVSASMVSVNWV